MSSNPGMSSDCAVFGEICSCSKLIKVSVFQCGSREERSTRPTIQWMSASKCDSFCAAQEGSSQVSGSDGSYEYSWVPKWSTVFAISETLRPQLCDYDCDHFCSDLAMPAARPSIYEPLSHGSGQLSRHNTRMRPRSLCITQLLCFQMVARWFGLSLLRLSQDVHNIEVSNTTAKP